MDRLPIDSASAPVRRRQHPAQWAMIAVLVVLLAMLVNALFTNPNFAWDTVAEYLFAPRVLAGIWTTVQLTFTSMLLGLVLGTVLAVLRLSSNRVLSGVAWLFVWFFRGTPLLVQLLFWGFAAALFPTLGLGIPFGPEFVTWDTNALIPFSVAAILGLGLNSAAYLAEIVRAGIISVPHGQSDAAAALGFGRLRTLRHVVLPQAMRVIIPPLGNETISMLKVTSLVLVIGVQDLLGAVTEIYAKNFKQIPLLIVACVWYLVMTSALSVGQYYIERKYGRGFNGNGRSRS
ncbi:amino acid ABC transporter permease [Nonomuraea sp. NPDC050536]|uniref:amino acid ABC transporter permease n=1 Tax=Nonomuraea sp. NPDC050536 TaxID=3364366 RepID=UPI0037CCB37C